MTLQKPLLPGSSLPSSPPSDEHLKDENTAQIGSEIFSQMRAAEACMESSKRLFKSLGYKTSPDECIDLLERTLFSMNEIFRDLPPQPDDEIIRKS